MSNKDNKEDKKKSKVLHTKSPSGSQLGSFLANTVSSSLLSPLKQTHHDNSKSNNNNEFARRRSSDALSSSSFTDSGDISGSSASSTPTKSSVLPEPTSEHPNNDFNVSPRISEMRNDNRGRAMSVSEADFKPMKEFGTAKGLVEFVEEPISPESKRKILQKGSRSFWFGESNQEEKKEKVKQKSSSEKKFETEIIKVQEEFQKLFDMPNEALITYSQCTLYSSGKQGRLFVASNSICFASSNGDAKEIIMMNRIFAVEKTTVKLLRAIEITSSTGNYIFTSFLSRDPVLKAINKIFDPIKQDNNSVYSAIKRDDIVHLKYLLKNKPMEELDFGEQGLENELPIHLAIRNGDIQIVDAMLAYYKEHNLDINQQDFQGWTSMHVITYVSSNGKNSEDYILKTLLNYPGINVSKENKDRNTCLHYFAQNFRSPSCQELGEIIIKKGCDVNVKNKNGETALHKACFNQAVRILMVELLISFDADVNVLNVGGETPLHYAVLLGRKDLLKILLKAGAVKSLNIKSVRAGKTPYELALEAKQDQICDLLKKVQDLADWLKSFDLEDFLLPFVKEDLFLDDLTDVDADTIESLLDGMGIESMGNRIRLKKAIQKLAANKPDQSKNDTNNIPKIEITEDEQSFKDKLNLVKKKDKDNTATSEQLASLSESFVSSVKEDWIIKHSELEYTKKLGSGASGKVYKGIYRNTKVAVKVLKTSEAADVKSVFEEFRKEFRVLTLIKSPYVVGIYGATVEPKICMVMEYCSRGSLYNVLTAKNFDMTWELAMRFMTQMVAGLKVLHTFKPDPIYHRDLKSLNILITEDWQVRLTDFGLARVATKEALMQTLNNVVGTICWTAGEVLCGKGFSDKSDIYGMGMILYEIVNRVMTGRYQRPFDEYNTTEFLIVAKIIEDNLTPTIPEGCPEALESLIRKCWEKDPALRPDVIELEEGLLKIVEDFKENKEAWLLIGTL